MKETGTITHIENHKIFLTMNQSDGCATCDLGHCCQISGTGKRQIKISAPGHTYKKGDLLEIETQAKSLLTAAFFVFILPILIAAAFYSIVFALKKNQDWTLIGFFIGFVLAEGLIFLLDKRFGQKKFFQPKIIRKIENEPSTSQP